MPATGAATALTDLAAGGVEFVSCSMPEAEALIKAGRIRSLAVHVAEARREFPGRADGRGGARPQVAQGRVARLRGPKGLPKEIATQYETAIKKVWDSAEFQEFMNKRGFDLIYMDSAKFAEFMKTDNQDNGNDAEVARAGEEVRTEQPPLPLPQSGERPQGRAYGIGTSPTSFGTL